MYYIDYETQGKSEIWHDLINVISFKYILIDLDTKNIPSNGECIGEFNEHHILLLYLSPLDR